MSIFGKGPDPKPVGPAAAPRKPEAPEAPRPGDGRACVIGPKTTLKGDVTGDEDVVVQGRIEGTVRLAHDLTIASGGSVKATVNARRVTVAGELNGDCQVDDCVEITASGKLFGNVKAPKLVIAEGAVFRGNSEMTGAGAGR